MKIIALFQFLAILSCACHAADNYFQTVEIASSPNPVGSGARALGMSAFIAVADDATAASWNPAGLIQLQFPEVSLVTDAFHRNEDNHSDIHPEASGVQRVSEINLNYLSMAYPFNAWGSNMIVSLNYQRLFDFTREWKSPLISREGHPLIQEIDYQQEGSLYALGLAYCVEIRPCFSFGLTLNLWDDSLNKNEWEQRTLQQGKILVEDVPFRFEAHSLDRYAFSGFNANLGVLWEVMKDKFVIGAVVKTPFTADLRHEHSRVVHYVESDERRPNHFAENETMEMPLSYGIGFAYKFSERLTLSLDVYRTEWDDFVLRDSQGGEKSPITGRALSESDIEPTHQVRVGVEYLLKKTRASTTVIPLCAGVFYDPEPAQGSPDDFLGLSIGFGVNIGENLRLGLAYQYRFGDDVREHLLNYSGDFAQDVEEHTLYSSLVIHF